MYCNHCGGEVQANQRFCGSCGKQGAVPTPPPPGPYVSASAGRVTRHVKTLAILWIALSALNLLKAGGRLVGARVIGSWGHDWFDDGGWGFPVGEILPAVLSTMGMVSLVLAAIGFV